MTSRAGSGPRAVGCRTVAYSLDQQDGGFDLISVEMFILLLASKIKFAINIWYLSGLVNFSDIQLDWA